MFKYITLLFTLMALQAFSQDYEYDKELLNKAGKREGLLTHTVGGSPEYTHKYVNGVLQEATFYNYKVEGKSSMKGIFREGKPYEGYFLSYLDRDLPVISYFVSGVQQARYDRDMNGVDVIEDSRVPFLKTIYKEGRPWKGIIRSMEAIGKGGLLLATEHIEEGTKTHVDLLLVAMHYAEELRLEFTKGGYKLINKSNVKDTARIVVSCKDKLNGRLSFYIGKEAAMDYSFATGDVTQPFLKKKSDLIYYAKAQGYIYKQKSDVRYNEALLDGYRGLLMKVFMAVDLQPVFCPDEESINNYALLFSTDEPENIINVLSLSEEGLPYNGPWIQAGSSATYKYAVYEEGKVTKQGGPMPAEALTPLIKFKSEY